VRPLRHSGSTIIEAHRWPAVFRGMPAPSMLGRRCQEGRRHVTRASMSIPISTHGVSAMAPANATGVLSVRSHDILVPSGGSGPQVGRRPQSRFHGSHQASTSAVRPSAGRGMQQGHSCPTERMPQSSVPCGVHRMGGVGSEYEPGLLGSRL
jgi:hypothetical protein